MRLLRVIAFWLLALYLPATNHCLLETATGLEVLQSCCERSDTQQANSCETDACSVVESGAYRSEENPPLLQPPCPVYLTLVCNTPDFLLADQAQFAACAISASLFLPKPCHLAWPVSAQPRAPSSIWCS